jgi:general secretion pathway protein M
MTTSGAWGRIAQRWQGFAPRERRLLLVAALVVGAALVWWRLLAPPLKVLREAPPAIDRLDRQLMQMRRQAQEIEALRRLPRAPRVSAAEFAAQAAAKARASFGDRLRVEARAGQVAMRGEQLAPAPVLALLQELQTAGGRIDDLQLSAEGSGQLKLAVLWRTPPER